MVEALPSNVPSNPAGGTGETSVNEVTQGEDRQCQSDHGAPSFRSTRHIDARVAAQMRVLVVAIEIAFTGVDVSFASILGVVLHFILGHGVTSRVAVVLLALVLPLAWSKDTASGGRGNASRLAGGWQVDPASREVLLPDANRQVNYASKGNDFLMPLSLLTAAVKFRQLINGGRQRKRSPHSMVVPWGLRGHCVGFWKGFGVSTDHIEPVFS